MTVRTAAAGLLALALSGSLGGSMAAGDVKEAPRWKLADLSSAREWHLKAENLVPHGTNPLYFPLQPGHRHALERPDHPDGAFRKETVVLSQTEEFSVPGIGTFRTAVVQDEEYIDRVIAQRTQYWLAFDRSTGSIHLFGRVTWEFDDKGKRSLVDTWRVGDPDSAATPGLVMPGTWLTGGRWISERSEALSLSGTEAMETGVAPSVPAGSFKGCVRTREQDLKDPSEITDRVWCRDVGLVLDSNSGGLVLSSALPKGNPASDTSSIGAMRNNRPTVKAVAAQISADQAKQIALAALPGRVTDLAIERKRGKQVYVVEIRSTSRGEKDVLVDMVTGDVLGIE